MLGQHNDWHKLVVEFNGNQHTSWFYVRDWLNSHCEGKYYYTTNVIKFELASDLILFQLGYKDE